MIIKKIEIENFRSINSRVAIHEREEKFRVFIGGNNTGKSNILRAINLFFNAETELGVPFSPATDFCKNNKKSIKINVEFEFSRAGDKHIVSYIDKKYPHEFKNYNVKIASVYYANGGSQYTFTTIKGLKKTMPDLLARIKEYINCVYVPAIKDYKTIINQQMMKKIVGATFYGWGRGRTSKKLGQHREKFQEVMNNLQSILNMSGDSVSEMIHSVIPTIERFDFSLPYDDLEEFLGKLIFEIKEKDTIEKISLEGEGSGIQSFTIYSMLRLLHEIRPKNTYKKAKFLWLIEEPETFMHNDLQRKTFEKLKLYSNDGHIFISTHSPIFIDKNNYANAYYVKKDKSTSIEPLSAKSMMDVLGKSLGVKFGDYFMFKNFNLLVEGESDARLLEGLNEIFKSGGDKGMLDLTNVGFIDSRSANGISTFFQMYSIFENYATFAALFDRDDAGIKNRELLLSNGGDKKYLLLVPQSDYRKKNAIEDIVEKDIWDLCLHELDKKKLITILMKGGQIIDYTFDAKDRVKVKTKFVELLLSYAKKDATKFLKYKDFLHSLNMLYGQAMRMKEA